MKMFKRRVTLFLKCEDGVITDGQMPFFKIDNACEIKDCNIPPGSRLEKLSGDRDGQYSIRINNLWRVCFAWKDNGVYNVKITDYH